MLPAAGCMVVPALLCVLIWAPGRGFLKGWAIPTAPMLTFALAVLAVVQLM